MRSLSRSFDVLFPRAVVMAAAGALAAAPAAAQASADGSDGGAALLMRPTSLSFRLAQDAEPGAQTAALRAGNRAAEFELQPNARWLTASPARGRLEAGREVAITVAANPAGMRAGTHTGRLYARAEGRLAAQVRVSLEVLPARGPFVSETGGVVNAARMSAYGEPGLFGPRLLPAAPGSIVAVQGGNFTAAGETFAASELPLPTSLGGVRVLFDEQPAPLFSAGPESVWAQLPSAGLLSRGEVTATASVVVEAEDGSSAWPRVFHVAARAPGVFTASGEGLGQGSVIFAGTSVLAAPRGYSGESRPARAGDIVEIYATGLGAVEPPPADGEAPGDALLRHAVAPVRVRLGGRPLAAQDVLFAGAAPSLVGVNVILARTPPGIPPSDAVEVRIEAGGVGSQAGVTMAVE